MRVTCDYDFRSKIKLWYYLLKGRIMCGKWADEIYKTRKGYHVIYRGLPITFEKSIELRKKLNDDKHRIELDLSSDKRISQVLFTEKRIRYYEPAKSFGEDKKLLKDEIFIRERM
jgi:hypothetical protein